MKKLIIILILIGAICGGGVLLWKAMLGDDNGSNSGSRSGDYAFRTVSRHIFEYAGRYREGWSDSTLNSAIVLIDTYSGDLGPRKVQTLRDEFASRSLAALDSFICSQYQPDMPAKAIGDIPSMAKAYHGLDVLAGKFNAITPSARFQRLRKDRELYGRLLAFANISHPSSAVMSPSLAFSNGEFRLRYNNPRNFQSYRNSIETKRQNLKTEYSANNDLAGIHWINTALDPATVRTKIDQAQEKYRVNERQAMINFLKRLSSPSNSDIYNEEVTIEDLNTLNTRLNELVNKYYAEFGRGADVSRANDAAHANILNAVKKIKNSQSQNRR